MPGEGWGRAGVDWPAMVRLPLPFLIGTLLLVACGDDSGTMAGPDGGGTDCLSDPMAPGCEPDPDPTCADADPCPADERCVDAPGGPVCECPAGSVREESACVPLDSCGPDTCDGRGECTDEGGTIACACDAGYAGGRCGECDAAAGYLRNAEGDCVTDLCDPSPCADPERRDPRTGDPLLDFSDDPSDEIASGGVAPE